MQFASRTIYIRNELQSLAIRPPPAIKMRISHHKSTLEPHGAR